MKVRRCNSFLFRSLPPRRPDLIINPGSILRSWGIIICLRRNRKFRIENFHPFFFSWKRKSGTHVCNKKRIACEAIREKGTSHGGMLPPKKAAVKRETRSGKTILLFYSIERVTLVMTRSYTTSRARYVSLIGRGVRVRYGLAIGLLNSE